MSAHVADKTMSVIVPVYNKSECLDECISSLVAQNADPSDFEVLIVDDGSTDDSLGKCLDYERTYGFIRVFSQENQGVSGARNTGLRHAVGKYIMFLDADDSISPNAITDISSLFFRLGESVDVVASKLQYHSKSDGRVFGHQRNKWLKETGIYRLDETPHIAQSTMNICIRNRFEDNIYFDTSLRMGEDQLFVTLNLARKAAIGYCADVEYAYTWNSLSASQQGNNPLYAFDDMLSLYSRLLDVADADERISRYAYSLILYNIDWRLRSNQLFPRHLSGDEYAAAEQRLASILGKIPHSAYAASPYLNAHHKAFLFEKYVHPGQSPTVVHDEKRTIVKFEDGSTWGTARAKIAIEQCLLHDDTLRVQGRITCPSFRFEDKPVVRVVLGESILEPELQPSSFSCANTKMLLGRIWWLEFEASIDALMKCGGVGFELLVDGESIPFELSPNLRQHNARIIDGVYYFPRLELTIDRSRIRVNVSKSRRLKKVFSAANRQDPAVKDLRLEIEREASRLEGKRLWLYADDPVRPIAGDALLQLLHDLSCNDGVERVYVSNFEQELISLHPELAGRIVSLGSERHKLLSVLADICVFSAIESDVRRPFTMDELAGIGDLARRQRQVFLPNGVLHAVKPWELSHDRLLADAVVSTTKREAELLEAFYGYPAASIIKSGLPRFDLPAHGRAGHTGKVLFAPSWRSYLLAGSGRTRMPVDAVFEKSSFFKGAEQLVSRFRSSALFSEAGCVLDIKLHPRFSCYEHLFERICGESVSMVSGPVDVEDYDVVITDYSSLVFDAVYAGCSVLYYVPDYQEFCAGMHEYREIEPSFEQGFGPLCITADEAMDKLLLVVQGKGSARFDQNCEELFWQTDGRSCERLYQDLSALVG